LGENRSPMLATIVRDERLPGDVVSGAPATSHDRSPDTSTLSLLTLNIGAAARPRAETICDWLQSREADVVVLTETSAGLGTRYLIEALTEQGYDRGVIVCSRVAVRRTLARRLAVTLPWRAVGIVLDATPDLAVLGIYVPSRDRTPNKVERKRAFIASLMASLVSLPVGLRDRTLILGDYNAVSRAHEPRLPGFFNYEYAMHDDLAGIGFVAAHELCELPQQPHSWVGRTGTGYLYDYVHAGRSLHDRVRAVRYIDEPRELRLSDHAAVAAEVLF
jgi:exodeoxyribonuclease-3